MCNNKPCSEFLHITVATAVPQQRFVITNNYGEKLVAVLHETGSKKLVILCHGFRATKVGCSDRFHVSLVAFSLLIYNFPSS